MLSEKSIVSKIVSIFLMINLLDNKMEVSEAGEVL